MSGPPNIGQAQQGGQHISFTYQFGRNGRPTILKYQGDLPGAITYLHRVRAIPGLVASTDPTIDHIQSQEENCVADLMQAFFDVSSVDDNPKSKVIAHCTIGRGGGSSCRLVHRKLILRCRYGFRGYESHDRLDTRHLGFQRSSIDEDDISGNCHT